MDLIKHKSHLLVSTIAGLLCIGSLVADASAIELVGPKDQKRAQTITPSIYGPITNSDTLWRIAFNARKDPSLSVDQVMIAIFMANPSAFTDNNINLLKNGSMLTIPDSDAIRSISDRQAKNKIAQDNKQLPVAKEKLNQTNVTPPVTKPVVKPQPVALETTEEKMMVPEIANIDGPAESMMSAPTNNATSKQLEIAMADMQLLIDENKALRKELSDVTMMLEKMKTQEAIDLQAHKELEALKQELANIEAAKNSEHKSIFNNGWFIAAISSIPALAGLGGLFYFLVRRFKGEAVVEEKTEQTPPPAPDLSVDDDELSEELLDDELLISEDDSGEDDELASLDDLDDDLLAPDLDDELLEQSFADSDELPNLDDDLDSVQLDMDVDDADAVTDDDSIISADDIDALLMQADAEGADDSDQDSTDDGAIVDPNDIEALLAEAAEQDANETVDADDIDALLDGAGDANQTVDADDIDALLDGAGDANQTVDADDIDALLDGASDANQTVDVDDIDALLDGAGDANQTVDADDIDALLDGASDDNQTVDADDIDALLDGAGDANQTVDADDIDALLNGAGDANETVDADDIDALLDGVGDVNETVDADDIDALLEGAVDANETVDVDDIDALLNSTELEDEVDNAAESVEIDEIDALLDSTELEDEVDNAAESVEIDDIDALLDSTELEDDVDNAAESVEIDDIDALLDSTELEDEVDNAAESVEIDDIDALLDSTELEDNVDNAAESVEIDDIDALLDSTELEDDVDNAAESVETDDIDSLLDSAVEDEIVDELTNDIVSDKPLTEDDIDSLLDVPELDETPTETSNSINADEIDALFDNGDIDQQLSDDEILSADDIDSVSNQAEIEQEVIQVNESEQTIEDIEAMLSSTDFEDSSEPKQPIETPEAPDHKAIYEGDTFDQPYLITQEHNSLAIDASEEAKHLVEALDSMTNGGEASADVDHSDNQAIDELDSILAQHDVASNSTDSTAEPMLADSEIELDQQIDKFAQENSFIDIDKLLNDSAVSDEVEPYKDVDLDTGLSEFPEVLPTGDPIDVDDDPNNSAKKLDLARAYLEIDDQDSAIEILEFVSENGDDVQQKEANRLMSKLKG